MSAAPPGGGTCARCRSSYESGEHRCPICGLAIPEGRAPPPERVQAQVVRCEGCRAAVSYSVEARAPRCAFCGWTAHLEVAADPREQVEAVVPFAVSPEEARAALQRWLGSRGFFAPADLTHAAQLEELRPLWWVAWVVDAEALVSWTADSDAGARRAAWAPHAGQVQLRFADLLIPATRGLTERESLALAPGFELAHAEATPRGPEGAVLESFELERSAARKLVLSRLEGHARERVQAEQVPGTRCRNLHTSLLLVGMHTRRVALPTYVLAYRYRSRLYRVLVHGQRAEQVLGKAPVSALKVALVVLGTAAAVALALLLFAR